MSRYKYTDTQRDTVIDIAIDIDIDTYARSFADKKNILIFIFIPA